MHEIDKQIIGAFEEAIEDARGENNGTREIVVFVPDNIDVAVIRKRLKMTQEEFADVFGFSLGSVRDWEQGRKPPLGSNRAFLTVIDRDPVAVFNALRQESTA